MNLHRVKCPACDRWSEVNVDRVIDLAVNHSGVMARTSRALDIMMCICPMCGSLLALEGHRCRELTRAEILEMRLLEHIHEMQAKHVHFLDNWIGWG